MANKGVLIGQQTAKRIVHLTSFADGVYGPSEVKSYADASSTPNIPVISFTLTSGLTTSGIATVDTTTDTTAAAVGATVTIQNPTGEIGYTGNKGEAFKIGSVWYLVELNRPKAFISFTLTGNLTSTGTATVASTSASATAAVGDSITVINPTGELAYTGATGTAVRYSNSWYVVEVNRPAPFLHVTLSCDSHSWTSADSARGYNADQTTPITVSFTKDLECFPVNFRSTVTISNPYNFNWKTGDRALLRKEDSTNYLVIKVFRQVCLRFRFKLTADAGSGSAPIVTATAICPSNSEDGPPPTGTVNIKDVYCKTANAKINYKGVAEYDWNNDWWYATECEHNAYRFRGTLNGSLTGGASFFSVTPVAAFDGKLPAGPLNVYNMHGWDAGTTGYVVSCEWNQEDGRYEAYQMRCPA